jgi:pyruvate dehydrogenase E2 component (dihydrolipoamide acetyltransferase)
MAEERGVDISKIRGTGPGGAITSDDILAAAGGEADSLNPVARLMAERTTQSWTQTPHFFLTREVDAGALVYMRKSLSAGISITDLLIAAAARVLVKHPRMRASWAGGRITNNSSVNISVAVAVKDGVVGVVIQDAANLRIDEIAARRKDLVERARAGRLRPADISGGTFTLSNLGMYGVDSFHAIITPPQAAVLAVGRIADRVTPVNGQPGIRPMLTLTLSSDHRVVDGAQAAAFLGDLARAIEE